jgi:hypothetical protein
MVNHEDSQDSLEHAMAVKARYEQELMRQPNVIGVGVGFRQRQGQMTDEVSIVVLVREKLTPQNLDDEEMLPSELDGVPVDVQSAGDVRALDA